MKKKISLLLAIVILVTLLPTAFAESKTADARKTSQKITLDGQAVDIGAYNIEGHNYVKLRDVAAIMTAKKSQFNVGYDAEKNLVIVETDKPYTKEAGDLEAIKDAKAKAMLEVKKIMVNGEAKDIKTALIKGNNYMQLRDLGRLVGFDVGYDEKTKTIVLKSDGKAEEKKEEAKTDDKKDDKKEEKKEKKDDKKEEVKPEAKIEGNVKVIKTDNFDELETAKLYAIEKLHDMFADHAGDDYIVSGNLFTKDIPASDYIILLKNMARAMGSDVYIKDHTTKKRIEYVDGILYYAVEFTYPNGSSLVDKISVEPVNGSLQFPKVVNIKPLIYKDEGKESILKNDNLFLCLNLRKFHDALADKNFKAASEALKALNFKATEENVKETYELRLDNAKKLGVEIFSKDYELEVLRDEGELTWTFVYKNGAKFKVYFSDNFIGFASLVYGK